MTVLLKVNIKPFHNIKEQEIFLTCFLYLRHVPGPKQLCVKDLIKTRQSETISRSFDSHKKTPKWDSCIQPSPTKSY